ncbi:hypothetical protein ACLB2K_065863 [Fragaria x ananassa]
MVESGGDKKTVVEELKQGESQGGRIIAKGQPGREKREKKLRESGVGTVIESEWAIKWWVPIILRKSYKVCPSTLGTKVGCPNSTPYTTAADFGGGP